MPAQAPTIATALKSMGYVTGQFGKNHLGDRNEFLPTVHGFDEYWGYPPPSVTIVPASTTASIARLLPGLLVM